MDASGTRSSAAVEGAACVVGGGASSAFRAGLVRRLAEVSALAEQYAASRGDAESVDEEPAAVE
jgi:hypothetical protein